MKTIQTKNPSNKNSNQKPTSHENLTTKKPKLGKQDQSAKSEIEKLISKYNSQ